MVSDLLSYSSFRKGALRSRPRRLPMQPDFGSTPRVRMPGNETLEELQKNRRLSLLHTAGQNSLAKRFSIRHLSGVVVPTFLSSICHLIRYMIERTKY